MSKTVQREDMFIELFSVLTFAQSAQNHIKTIQDGLYHLLKNKLSPNLVNLHTINNALETLKKMVEKRGYKLVIQ